MIAGFSWRILLQKTNPQPLTISIASKIIPALTTISKITCDLFPASSAAQHPPSKLEP